jgi:hypothetical protein
MGWGVLCVDSAPAFAQSATEDIRGAARSLANHAADAYDAGDYPKAADLFRRAYALVPVPSLSIYLARSLEKSGRLLEALDAYQLTARSGVGADSPEPFRRAVRDAGEAIDQLEPRIPRVKIVVSGDGADDPRLEVTIDGRPVKSLLVGVEFPVDPGDHQFRATTPNGASAVGSATFGEGERKTIEIQLEGGASPPTPTEASAPAPSQPLTTEPMAAEAAPTGITQRTWGYVGLGVGAAGVGVGVVTGLMAARRHSAAEDACGGYTCLEGGPGTDEVEAFRSLRTVSTIGYVVGILGAGVGATLLLADPTADKQRAPAGLTPYLGPGSVGLHGRF